MKSKEELYEYCVKKNTRTKKWCSIVRGIAGEELKKWESKMDETGECIPGIVKMKWALGQELWSVLEKDCREPANYRDVLWVVDKICQDIGKELTISLKLHEKGFCLAKFRLNDRDEAAMYLGPLEIEEKRQMFSDNGVFMTRGYDACI